MNPRCTRENLLSNIHSSLYFKHTLLTLFQKKYFRIPYIIFSFLIFGASYLSKLHLASQVHFFLEKSHRWQMAATAISTSREIWVKVFKNGQSKFCGRQLSKNFTWSILEYLDQNKVRCSVSVGNKSLLVPETCQVYICFKVYHLQTGSKNTWLLKFQCFKTHTYHTRTKTVIKLSWI